MRGYLFVGLCCWVILQAAGVRADTTIVYVATDVPVTIPDGPSGIAQSSMQIADAFEIIDLNVVVTITHSFDQDLRIYLEGPNEDVARLADQCGQSGNNYIQTRFDDEATTPICSGSPPFTGDYRPDVALTLFDGIIAAGTWSLRVTDNAAQDVGTLDAWSLEITYAHVPVGDAPPVIADFRIQQNYPNPFNPTTILPIEIARPSNVELRVFDALGRSVFNEDYFLGAGSHDLRLDGTTWSSGTYFARVSTVRQSRFLRMVLLK